MSSSNTNLTNLDLEALEQALLPAWAQQSSAENRYAGYDRGNSGTSRAPGDRSYSRPRDRQRSPSRDQDRGRPSQDSRRPGGPRPPGAPGGPRPDRDRDRGFRPMDRRDRPEPAPLPPVETTILPEEKGAEALARQIKLTGRAFPIFDVAQLILLKPERYVVRFVPNKGPDGKPVLSLCLCQLDDSLWLDEAEAVDHVLRRHFATFYQAEKIPAAPPKGTYTFVAQCGLSGAVLGPPNYHDYQTKLHKLHSDRFSRMPFDVYKSKVRIVREEAVVKQWVEEQSWKTEYICLNVPEAARLTSRADVEKHFREVHMPTILRSVESHTQPGVAAQQAPCRSIRDLARRASEDQRRFPLKLVTSLSHILAGHGLQFFKVKKSITHVSVARPRYLDLETTPVSTGIRRIVDYINGTPGCTRRTLIDALAPAAPSQPATLPAIAASAAPPEVQPPQGAAPATEASSVEPTTTAHQPSANPVASATADASRSSQSTTPAPAPSPEQTAVISDLHWLVHQGHVLEFSNGVLESAHKPLPKPPRPTPPAKAPRAAEFAAPQATPGDGSQSTAASSGEASSNETAPSDTPAAEITATAAVESSMEEPPAALASSEVPETVAVVSEIAAASSEIENPESPLQGTSPA